MISEAESRQAKEKGEPADEGLRDRLHQVGQLSDGLLQKVLKKVFPTGEPERE